MRFSSVIVAAGAGLRAGGETPKQWRLLAGRPAVRWSVEAMLAAGAHDVVVVVGAADRPRAEAALAGLSGWRLVEGGRERIESVRNGLAALEDDAPEGVLIHDAARPLLAPSHVETLLAALDTAEGALPALPVADTLKRAGDDRIVESTAAREGLWRAQTPQAFRFPAIMAAYAAWPGGVATDDAAVLEAAGGRVQIVPGDPRLMKLTYAEDFPMAEAMAAGARMTRVGLGLDAHVFGEGDHVWLCGLKIPHDHTLVGHSDADAGLHALTDALLGAIGQGDIGDHFPPTDPQWKGASSDQFLLHAVKLATEAGGRIVNADLTLICERPKVKPHREAMRERVAQLLGIPTDRVNVKATTMEKMGFTGREEGLAAQAVIAVEMPA